MADDALVQLQLKAVARLAADQFFSNVPILCEHLKQAKFEAEKALGPDGNGAQGVIAVVGTPRCQSASPNVPGPWFDKVQVIVSVVEDVTVNQADGGTGKPAIMVAKAAARVLHLYGEPNIFAPLIVNEIALASIDRANGKIWLVYDLKINTSLRDTEPSVKLE